MTLRIIIQLSALAFFATLAALNVSGYVFLGITLGVVALSFFVGPVFCGWGCPVGAAQDVIGLPLKRYRLSIPKWLDRVLAWYRYVVLAIVVTLAVTLGTQPLQNISPFGALYDFATSTPVGMAAIISLIVIATVSFIISRPFCRYVCPYGALLGLSNLIRLMPVTRDEISCTDCGACDRVCPMNIEVASSYDIRDVRCISCMECSSDGGSCPKARTLRLAAPSTAKTVIWAVIALTLVASFIGYNSWMAGREGALTCPSTTCVSTICHATGPMDRGEDGGYSAVSPPAIQTCPATGCTAERCHATDPVGPGEGGGYYTINPPAIQTCPATGCTADSCHAI